MSEDRNTGGRPGARRLLGAAGLLMAVAAVVLFAVGSGGDDRGSRAQGGTVPEAGSRFRGDRRPATSTAPATASAAEVERRVAQLFIAGFPAGGGPQRDWGAVLVTDGNFRSTGQLRGVLDAIDRRAVRRRDPKPLVVADPSELGRLGPAPQPQVGGEGTQADARETARRSARRVRTAGVDAVLAPSADLGVGGGPAEDRAFGDDPRGVAAYVFQAVDGWKTGGVLPIPGRFPGEGGASQDPIEGPATVGLSLDELVARDVRPFAGAVSKAPAMQMSAALYAAWDGVTPATLLPEAVGLLRGRLGFRGAVVSADLNAATAATGASIGAAAVDALNAGCDLLLVPGGQADQDDAFAAVVKAVRGGRVLQTRLDDALGHVAALRKAAAALR